jgi:hypothetical protein
MRGPQPEVVAQAGLGPDAVGAGGQGDELPPRLGGIGVGAPATSGGRTRSGRSYRRSNWTVRPAEESSPAQNRYSTALRVSLQFQPQAVRSCRTRA